MNEQGIQTVLVVGAGSIGKGVAKSFAQAGFVTQVLSRNPARLRGQLEGVALLDRLPDAAPDLIVESIPELRELKLALYASIEDAYRGAAIVGSNTSSLPLADLAAQLRYPGQFLGTHYLYPADTSEFVEVIRTGTTSDGAVERVADALKRCGKTPVVLKRPVIGALVNRLQHAILREAYYLIDQGFASAEQIDDIARRFLAPRMCITGLMQQKDISGLDTHALAQRSIVPHLCRDKTPSAILQGLFEQGHLGLKTGRGFYDWSNADAARVRAEAARKVARIAALMRELDAEASGGK
ncbi:MAG: 3-hydroxyacyl-CoA dehydrogenase family protein [SAR324 cluster bacterium]